MTVEEQREDHRYKKMRLWFKLQMRRKEEKGTLTTLKRIRATMEAGRTTLPPRAQKFRLTG
jgi:hypothetical protein